MGTQPESAVSSTSVEKESAPEPKVEVLTSDEFVRSCFDISIQEKEDSRWFSNFGELPKIDEAIISANYNEALQLVDEGLVKYPDSFLFYGRKAKLHTELGDPKAAENVCLEGISQCLSKTDLCERIGTLAFEQGEDMKAVRWWIIACVVQSNAKVFVHYVPYLHLAYVAEGLGLTENQQYLLQQADRISPSGSIRYNAEAEQMHHAVATRLEGEDALAVRQAITALRAGYTSPFARNDQNVREEQPQVSKIIETGVWGTDCPLCGLKFTNEPNYVHCETGHAKIVCAIMDESYLTRDRNTVEAFENAGYRVDVNSSRNPPLYSIYPK